MWLGKKEKQMRDVKEQMRVNEIRDTKSKNKEGYFTFYLLLPFALRHSFTRIPSLLLFSSLLVYSHPVSAP